MRIDSVLDAKGERNVVAYCVESAKCRHHDLGRIKST